jgi:hypothetical protein
MANEHKLNLFFTPVALAIALFGTEPEILSFKRSLKSLFLCVFVMIFAVQLFVCINDLAHRITWPKGLKIRFNRFRRYYDGGFAVNTDSKCNLT